MLLLHLLLIFKTTAQRVPIITFNTLSVQERRKLSAYVFCVRTPINPTTNARLDRNQLFWSGRQVKRVYQRRKQYAKILV